MSTRADIPEPSPEKKEEWRIRAEAKGAIVPHFFEVFPHKVELVCGDCRCEYSRTLIPNLNDPVFACPDCKKKNFVPVRYKIDFY